MARAGFAVTNCRKRVFADIRHGNRVVRHLWVPIGRHSGQHQAAVRMWELVKRVGELLQSRFLLQAMPVLVAMLVIVLPDHSTGADPDWGRLIWRTGNVGALLLPALAAHLAACSLRPWPAALVWFAGFVAYPTVFAFMAGSVTLPVWQWVLVAGFSLAFLLLHPGARGRHDLPNVNVPPILRLPITLDGTIAALLGVWVLSATSLLASTQDAVRNQPLRVWVDWQRIAAEPGETLWYLAQFTVLAVVFFGWYWVCRYVLVRRVLRQKGIVPLAFAVVAFVAVGTPVAMGIALQMPLNIPEWTLLPSENHNPFDPDNYRFAMWISAILLPIILTVERLLAEQSEAGTRHERVRAELHLLQQQINPHFLFNTLNTLYALCLKDRAESAAAVIKLSDLLRYVVYRGQSSLVSLDDEVDYLRNYLDLQQLRFGHRCALHAKWPEAGTGLGLPPLLLIMLLENAFKHGVEPVDGACEVQVMAAIEGRRLHFECMNPLPSGQLSGTPGMGLANLRRRLELLFGQNFHLSTEQADGFWRARLELDLEPC
ncbi:MAG: hypothetical protein C0510_00540 [Erythrobacter sp.]|nr:hypothetical protein [Erythrobacter sp.]